MIRKSQLFKVFHWSMEKLLIVYTALLKVLSYEMNNELVTLTVRPL